MRTMYAAANSLAREICLADGRDFDEVWNSWVSSYQPPESFRNDLRNMGRQLAEVGNEYIRRVPEKDYRNMVAYSLKPSIDQEEMYGTEEKVFGGVQ